MLRLILEFRYQQSKIDLEVPGEIPVKQLLEMLEKALSEPHSSPVQWVLRDYYSGKILDLSRSLLEQGIYDGSSLEIISGSAIEG